MKPQKVVISDHLELALANAIDECSHDRLFVLTDETTHRCCLPVISHFDCMKGAQEIVIGATDSHKTLDSLSHVWSELQRMGATRHSLMVNLGGGMVTDLGGFAASTFKRGIPYINIPTTLLSMVDASVGGKTGINFGGLKNEIGVFNNACCVILDTTFLQTMDEENLLSGYAEMLKHGLIDCEEHWAQLLRENHGDRLPDSDKNHEPVPVILSDLSPLVEKSVAVKQRIVLEDPTEKGIRKALNLGHTIGHAFESLALSTMGTDPSVSSAADNRGAVPSVPLLHGYFVAYGLIAELYLCCVKMGFPQDKMRQTVTFIKEHYGKMTITCDDYPRLIELMHHDKKNAGHDINFTLLADIGDIRINQTATEEEIKEALDFYREC